MKKEVFIVWAMGILLAMGYPSLGDSAEPIKMVSLDVISGTMKFVGDAYQDGIKFAVEEINAAGGLLGRPIEMFYDDHQLKPDVGTRKALRYILEDKVTFIVGGTATNVGQALSDLGEKEKIIVLNYGWAGDDLTGKLFNRHHFRVSLSVSQHSTALAAYLAGTPYKTCYILCQDYSAPRQGAAAFKRAMDRFKPGWKLVGEDYHPVGAKDLAPYISKVIDSKAELLFTINWGGDLIVLLKQAAALGCKAKVVSFFISDPIVCEAAGDAAVGAITAEIYMLTVDTPKNKALIERWKKRKMTAEHPYPDLFVGKAYQAFMFLAEAIKKANSTKAENIIKAWEGLSYESPMGRMTMRTCDHQALSPIPVAEIRPGPGHFFKFPYVGKPAAMIPADKAAVPPEETGNPRCK
jgi:branched-chain amino acid transport system substrate-binding protein